MDILFSENASGSTDRRTISFCKSDAKTVRIPERYEGIEVSGVAPRALDGCQNMEKLILPDSLESFGGSALRFCKKLRQVDILTDGKISKKASLLASSILRDVTSGLTVRFVSFQGGLLLELFFPPYVESFEEDTYARAMHPFFEGSGYAYRETARAGTFDLPGYDNLFDKAVRDGVPAAFRVALSRLLAPVSLADSQKAVYREYLKKHGAEVLFLLFRAEGTKEDERERIRFLLAEKLPDKEAASAAVPLATRKKDSELVSLLMAYSKKDEAKKPTVFAL